MKASPERSAKPMVVGLFHGTGSIGEPHFARELDRVERILKALPPRSRVGIEMPPNAVDWVKAEAAAGSLFDTDALPFAAKTAVALGHEIIPLDTAAALKRHHALLAEKSKPGQGAARPDAKGAENRKEKAETYNYLRSAIMGRKILDARPDVAFIGDFHARHLRPLLKNHYRFQFTREAGGFTAEQGRLNRLKYLAGFRMRTPLRSRLEAHLRKAIGRRLK